MDGGTFTISNGGVFGSMFGTPIINLPQSAILGMHGIFQRPVAIDGKVRRAVPPAPATPSVKWEVVRCLNNCSVLANKLIGC